MTSTQNLHQRIAARAVSAQARSPRARRVAVSQNGCGGGPALTERIVALWLHGRSPHTIRAYRADVSAFFEAIGKPLDAVDLSDLQTFADRLNGEATSRRRHIMAIKSLFTFATTIGAARSNVGAALRAGRVRGRV